MSAPDDQRFEIHALLREDPRFVRHEAYDRKLQCKVMIERPGPAIVREVALLAETLLKKARLLARISHPGVVRLREVVELDDLPALVLDLPIGESLEELLARDGTLPPERVVQLGRDLAQAAHAAHAEGVVHRGIAAENVYVEPGSGRGRLAGFTFAKLLERRLQATSLHHRRRGDGSAALAGLPTYVAPEQLLGRGADHRADVFALGCLLYRAAKGREAFASDAVAYAPPPPAHRVPDGPRVPRALSDVIGKCLALHPSQRFQTMIEVDAALAAVATKASSTPNAWLLGAALGAAAVVAAFAVPQVVGAITTAELQRGRPIDPAPAQRDRPAYSERFEQSYALVIGTDYTGNQAGIQPLRNAQSDAEAVAAALDGLGWHVTRLLGPDAARARIMVELENLLQRKQPDDRALVYFAGHGDLHKADRSAFYVLPDDAGPHDPTPRYPAHPEPRHQWIAAQDLVAGVTGATPKHVLLVLDCCHAGAIQRSAFGPGLDDEDEPASNYRDAYLPTVAARWILTSAAREETASDGIRGAGPSAPSRSPFAAGFLAALENARSKPQDVFTILQAVKDSLAQGHARQLPWAHRCRSSSKAEFLLTRATRAH